jgi:hypothetical protein
MFYVRKRYNPLIPEKRSGLTTWSTWRWKIIQPCIRRQPIFERLRAGVGMVEKGQALSEDLGPGLGRGMGFGTAREKAVSHMAGMQHPGYEGIGGLSLEERRRVPGYPQDMWTPMGGLVAKSETQGCNRVGRELYKG